MGWWYSTLFSSTYYSLLKGGEIVEYLKTEVGISLDDVSIILIALMMYRHTVDEKKPVERLIDQYVQVYHELRKGR